MKQTFAFHPFNFYLRLQKTVTDLKSAKADKVPWRMISASHDFAVAANVMCGWLLHSKTFLI